MNKINKLGKVEKKLAMKNHQKIKQKYGLKCFQVYRNVKLRKYKNKFLEMSCIKDCKKITILELQMYYRFLKILILIFILSFLMLLEMEATYTVHYYYL